MKAKNTIRNTCILMILLFIMFACDHPLVNPVDPEAENYQGYTTYDDPDMFELVSPTDGAEIAYNLSSYDLICSEIIAETEYTFQLAEDYGFTSIVDEGTITDTTYTFTPSDLTPGATYYWRAKVGAYEYINYKSFEIWQPTIGDNFEGGIVFYLDGSGGGLVCAESDQSRRIEWGGSGTDIGGDDSSSAPELDGLGYGLENTEAIVAALGDNDGTPYAAKLCYDLELNGYDDWFLPSKDELNLMYEDLHLQGLGGFRSDYYWSSSESNYTIAWLQNFNDGYQDYSTYKTNENRVRAVRAFSY